MLKKISLVAILAGLSSVAMASPLDGLTVKVGASILNPTADSLGLEATNQLNFTPSLDYRFGNSPFSLEVLLALPFDQTVKSTATGAEVASLKHLPPTFTAKYHLPEYNGLTAYAGVGATVFIPWDEKLKGSNSKLEADYAVGPAAQIGVNFKPADAKNWGVYADVRYADLKTEIKIDGAKQGDLEINPLVYTIGYSYNF